MPRQIRPIYTDFYWKPLTEDVEELLRRFQQADTVRYEAFSAIWREMGFSEVFLGIKLLTEMKRFCSVALSTAVKYFLPPYTYQIQVGGLYLMYAFYHMQFAVPPVKIRVALKDWYHFQRFLQASVRAAHYDVVYVFRRLVAAKALHFAAMQHYLTFRKEMRCSWREPEPQTQDGFLGRSTSVAELVSPETLEELANVQAHYERLRVAVAVGQLGGLPYMVQRDLPARLYNCARSFVAWQERTFLTPEHRGRRWHGDHPPTPPPTPEPELELDSGARAQLLLDIKGRSYGTYQPPNKARRHRQLDHRVPKREGEGSGSDQSEDAELRRGRGKARSLRFRTERQLRVREAPTNIHSCPLSVPELDKLSLKRMVLGSYPGKEEDEE